MVVLPAPVEPTKAIFWPGLAIEVDVVQDDLLRGVAEVHVVEASRRPVSRV